jgi:putative transposase
VRRAVLTILIDAHRLSITQACRIVGCSRTAFYRPPTPLVDRDAPVITALNAVVAAKTRWGFWKCFDRLRQLGHAWNHML